ncbi:hypothetical protein G1C97_2267 [Bifidobacterium sp. DSM 109959]|uniref:Uncharacterized protein n=2 Tax=Bifidobacterium olomucense TaxID=2675324 RepID=A0A7Y0EZL3_9BIFI|nr:hypothetical protein [Bifidobacterium sp. DSM 109959]
MCDVCFHELESSVAALLLTAARCCQLASVAAEIQRMVTVLLNQSDGFIPIAPVYGRAGK